MTATIYTPARIGGLGTKANVSFTTPAGAKEWINRQITGGDDGNWTISTSYAYESLDEHDKDKGIGEYGPRLTLDEVRQGKFTATTKRVPLSVRLALQKEANKKEAQQ